MEFNVYDIVVIREKETGTICQECVESVKTILGAHYDEDSYYFTEVNTNRFTIKYDSEGELTIYGEYKREYDLIDVFTKKDNDTFVRVWNHIYGEIIY